MMFCKISCKLITVWLAIAAFLASTSCTAVHNATYRQNTRVIVTESVFLDTPPNKRLVYVQSDNVIPNLKAKIIQEMKHEKINVVDNYAKSTVVLSIKTRFSDKVRESELDEMLHEEIDFSTIDKSPLKMDKERKINKTTIDRLIEDPSGMIIGFAVGAASTNPIVYAPIGMAIGSVAVMALNGIVNKTTNLTIFDVEVREKATNSIQYSDKRIHKKDEYSTRRYEFSEKTNWKVYRLRILVIGSTNEIEKRISSLVI